VQLTGQALIGISVSWGWAMQVEALNYVGLLSFLSSALIFIVSVARVEGIRQAIGQLLFSWRCGMSATGGNAVHQNPNVLPAQQVFVL